VLNEEIEGPLTKIKKLRENKDRELKDRAEMIGLALKYEESSWVNDMEGISGALLIEAYKISEKQAIKIDNKRKASFPRPKKNPTIRALTIESMRACRADYHTLNDFIESAKNDSVKGLELEETEKDNKRVFELKWESLPEKEDKDVKLTSYSTLEKWWAAALKKPM
jgi:hypothetical protein